MLEYVFFDQQPFDQFVAFLQAKGLTPEVSKDDDSFEVAIPETINDSLSDEIEVFYDQMMDLNRTLFEQQEATLEGEKVAAGVVLNLKNGSVLYANVESDLLAKIVSVLTPVEFGRVVDAIVDAVENPDQRPMCQRDT